MMSPRERVIFALNHKEPDKIPIDFSATNISGITRVAYDNLRAYLNLEPDPTPFINHIQQGSVYPLEDIYQRYQVDFRPVTMKKAPRWVATQTLPDGGWYDEYNIRWKKGSYYHDTVESPLTHATLDDLNTATWPNPYDPGRTEGLRQRAEDLYTNTDYAIVADIMCRGPYEEACKVRGYVEFLTDMIQDHKFAEALLEKVTEIIIGLWDVYLDAVGDYVQVVCQGDDLGMQGGLIISPELYRKLIKPCHQKIYSFIHSKTDAKILMHTDGSVFDIIPDLIEVGVDILNPVQYHAANMELSRLKREFGQELSFWGAGIDVQMSLSKPINKIKEEVQRNIDIMAPGGGYVFATTHNIQHDTSLDRIDAVFNTALEYRTYPIGHQ
jgi:uroporphyrinogen decarboxylase